MFAAKFDYNKFLESLADVLDITSTQFEQAKTSYEAAGAWLSRDASPISKYNPIIYPQGSFRIGTVIKPIADEDNFDVDVVCLLENLPFGISQKDLKQMVGDALKTNDAYKRMLKQTEGRRCWTLQYADDRKFHMDILPATNDDFGWLIQEGVEYDKAQHAIKITDKESETFETYNTNDWPKSNPIGYGNWFKEQMLVQLTEEKRILAELKSKSIETIQDFEVKTPLQRAVQILKRHRDFMFGDDVDRPISIIISTLAAKAYSNEPTLYDALFKLLDNMPNHIEGEKGNRKVYNPVNPEENFADKWEEYPDRDSNFYDWLSKAKEDFIEIFNINGFQKSVENLRESFGELMVNEALRRRNLEYLVESRDLVRKSNSGVFSVAHKEPPTWFMNLSKNVIISANYGSFRQRHTVNSKDFLPKNIPIKFNAITNVETPFNVYWQVVNTGQEAGINEDLRGSIFPAKTAGRGGLQHNENTRYKGTHWIECFIVKDGICVARSEEFIVKIA